MPNQPPPPRCGCCCCLPKSPKLKNCAAAGPTIPTSNAIVMANAISLPLSVNARKKHFGLAMCFGRSQFGPQAGHRPATVVAAPWLHPRALASRRLALHLWSVSPTWLWDGSAPRWRLVLSSGAIDQMRVGNGFRLGAPVVLEFGPDASEREQRAAIIDREPHDIFLFGLGVRLRRIRSSASATGLGPRIGNASVAPFLNRSRIAAWFSL